MRVSFLTSDHPSYVTSGLRPGNSPPLITAVLVGDA
jgi:hypothetical protein